MLNVGSMDSKLTKTSDLNWQLTKVVMACRVITIRSMYTLLEAILMKVMSCKLH